jgi:hypothetical protein
MKTFIELNAAEKPIEEDQHKQAFPTFTDVMSSTYKVSTKKQEVDEATKKLEELQAELASLQKTIEVPKTS